MGIYRTTNPTEFDDVDGIIVNEVEPVPNIVGVPTNIAILLGQFQRGPTTLTEVGSIGQFLELYGKSSFSGNKQLKNKRFGRLRIVRVQASDAVKATLSLSSKIKFDAKFKGAYGNNIQVQISNADDDIAGVAEISSVTALAASTLDPVGAGEYFLLNSPTVGYYVWFQVTDGNNQTDPAVAGRTGIEVEILAADTAAQVATKIQTVLDAHAAFVVPAPVGAVLTITNAADGSATDVAAGTSGFTVSVSTQGVTAVDEGVTYTIKDNNTNAVLPVEVYKNIKIAEITAATFAASQLVDVEVLDDASEPANCSFTNLASGSDGTVANTDYEAALVEAEVEGAGQFLFLDEYNSVRNGYLKVHAALTQDKMVIVCGPESQTRAAAVSDAASYRDSDGRIVYAYPYVQSVIDGALAFTPPASWLASIMSQTSPHVDPAFTGNSQYLAGITDLKLTLTRSDYIALKDAGVAAFEFDPDIGFKLKSGVVTQIANSSKTQILRRRMADYLTNSAAKFLKNYQNAVNSSANRAAVKGAFLDFIRINEQDGVLPGDKEVKTGLAKLVDTESLNTDNSIAQGFFKILWKQRIFSSMRYIVLQAEIGESIVVTEQE